jgi:hypothetical protein
MTSFKPGQTIKCTVTSKPKSDNRAQTIERLMRLDPASRRSLKKAHRVRQQRLNVYNRGNRDWTSREICARIVRCEVGNTWTMRFDHNIATDLAAVATYLKIEAA